MKKLVIIGAILLMISGCSTNRNEAAPIESAGHVEDASPLAPGIELPYVFELSGEQDGDETVVTLRIEYRVALKSAPMLNLTPHGDTVVTNMMLTEQLPVPEKAGVVTREIRLKGTEPGVDVSISQNSDGFGVELHDTWPPEKKKRERSKSVEMEELPAAIEVGGAQVTHGIDVHP